MNILNGRYQILQKIGEGAMGAVYRALDKSNQNFVAIKQCSISQDQKLIERFKREYQFLIQSPHKNIVKALDLFKKEQSYYIVMEYVEGITLGELICDRVGSITFEKQLEIAIQICEGIAFLNQKGIMHRDLKPENIMLTENYAPKILDLGIAKSQMHMEMDSLTSTGMIVGTIAYMSPEQFIDKKSSKMDVFSLAAVLYQFFAWLPSAPFLGINVSYTMQRVLQDELPCISMHFAPGDMRYKALGNILQLALHKNPKHRINSNKFLTWLQKLQNNPNPKNLCKQTELLLANNKPKYDKTVVTITCIIILITVLCMWIYMS